MSTLYNLHSSPGSTLEPQMKNQPSSFETIPFKQNFHANEHLTKDHFPLIFQESLT